MTYNPVVKGSLVMVAPSPSEMPKKPSVIRQKLASNLIETTPSTWKQKIVRRGEDGKDVVDHVDRTRDVLRFPLARNVSEDSVERAAKNWLL